MKNLTYDNENARCVPYDSPPPGRLRCVAENDLVVGHRGQANKPRILDDLSRAYLPQKKIRGLLNI